MERTQVSCGSIMDMSSLGKVTGEFIYCPVCDFFFSCVGCGELLKGFELGSGVT